MGEFQCRANREVRGVNSAAKNSNAPMNGARRLCLRPELLCDYFLTSARICF
jgi:hypothetical protein